MILVGGKTYELVHEHKNAWNADAFKERYSEVLDRYDYIVGDWGYNQLRLKGFFREGNSKANKDSTIAGLQDYLQEYCNFGCAYFVLERAAAGKGAGTGGGDALGDAHANSHPQADADSLAPVASNAPSGTTLAGGHAFSDRKPYSWREHQSPSRLSGRFGGDRKEASGSGDNAREAGNQEAVNERSGGHNQRNQGEDSVRIHGGSQRNHDGGRNRSSEDRSGSRGGDRMNAQGQEDSHERSEKGHRGGGRKFHHKGGKHSGSKHSRGGGGQGNRSEGNRSEGNQRNERGSRSEGSGRNDADSNSRSAQRGAQQ